MLVRALAFVAVIFAPQSAFGACRALKAESDVAGIRLVDETSTARILGSLTDLGAEQRKDARGRDLDFPYLRLTSADGRQEIRLFEHYGTVVGAYSEIEVRQAPPDDRTVRRVQAREFTTERGIRIGMTQANLTKLLGSCYQRERRESGDETIAYRISDPNHPLLKRTGYESYFARYVFRQGRLAAFRFGVDPL